AQSVTRGNPDQGQKQKIEVLLRGGTALEHEQDHPEQRSELERRFRFAPGLDQALAPFRIRGNHEQRRGDEYADRIAQPEPKHNGDERVAKKKPSGSERSDVEN